MDSVKENDIIVVQHEMNSDQEKSLKRIEAYFYAVNREKEGERR